MLDGERGSWVEEEFGEVDLGDERLNRRLLEIAKRCSENSQGSLPVMSQDPAMLKAIYRFFDNDCIEPNDLLCGHIAATYRRMAQEKLVLAPNDTCLLDLSTHKTTKGIGPLGSEAQQGLLMHNLLAFTEEGVPLGLLSQWVWARDAENYAQLKDHKTRPIEEKESYKWIRSLETANLASEFCPKTQIVCVGDREADIYDLFVYERRPGVDLLIRSAQDRCVVEEEKYLQTALQATPATMEFELHIPARNGQAARVAQMEVHWREVTLRPPSKRAKEHLPTIRLWAVWACEPQPPKDLEAVDWLLLSTVPVHNTQDAMQRLEWYARRWGIEIWHKILKSGCRIESRQLGTALRLERCLATFSVIAWHIHYATLLARVAPDLPCTILLEDTEWQALYCSIHNTVILPKTVPTISQAVLWIAKLGGFLNRKRDGFPGVTVLWKGFQHLADLSHMYRICRPNPPAPLVGKS